jgi:hypothetical protein
MRLMKRFSDRRGALLHSGRLSSSSFSLSLCLPRSLSLSHVPAFCLVLWGLEIDGLGERCCFSAADWRGERKEKAELAVLRGCCSLLQLMRPMKRCSEYQGRHSIALTGWTSREREERERESLLSSSPASLPLRLSVSLLSPSLPLPLRLSTVSLAPSPCSCPCPCPCPCSSLSLPSSLPLRNISPTVTLFGARPPRDLPALCMFLVKLGLEMIDSENAAVFQQQTGV